jgi:hypothetical protein
MPKNGKKTDLPWFKEHPINGNHVCKGIGYMFGPKLVEVDLSQLPNAKPLGKYDERPKQLHKIAMLTHWDRVPTAEQPLESEEDKNGTMGLQFNKHFTQADVQNMTFQNWDAWTRLTWTMRQHAITTFRMPNTMDPEKGGKTPMIGRLLSELKWAQEAQQMGKMGTHELQRRVLVAASGETLQYRKCYKWIRQTCIAGDNCPHLHYGEPYPTNRQCEANWDE